MSTQEVHSADAAHGEEEEASYKHLPANKADHLCQAS